MNFRDEIAKINSDRMTIEDADLLISEILDIAAISIYKSINNAIVETYKKERSNHITGYYEADLFEGYSHEYDNKSSPIKYEPDGLLYIKGYSRKCDNSWKIGTELSMGFSYSRENIIDFLCPPDVRFVKEKYTYAIEIYAYACQNLVGRHLFKGKEYHFEFNKYANILSSRVASLGKKDGVDIAPKIPICRNAHNNSSVWKPDMVYLDPGNYVGSEEKLFLYGHGLVFQYSAHL